jgi:hypothetical protein
MVFKNEGGVRRNRFTCSLFVGVSWHAVSLREYGMYVCLEVLLVHSTCDVAHLHIRLKTIYWTCALLQPLVTLTHLQVVVVGDNQLFLYPSNP